MLMRSAAAALWGIVVLVLPARAEENLDRVPDELRGVWGADCSKPEMRFDERALYQFSDRSTSPIRKVVRRAGEIELHYDRPREKLRIVDTFQVQGSTLRLTKSVYGAQALRWNKRPWQRCGSIAAAAPAPPLNLSALRFPGEQPTPTSQPHLVKVVKAVSDATKAACETPRFYHWNVTGRPLNDVTAIIQGIAGDLRARNFKVTKQNSPVNNIVIARVDNAVPTAADTPLMLAFYLEDRKDFYLIACVTK